MADERVMKNGLPRRAVLKGSAASALAGALPALAAPRRHRPPNIVVILTDDLGFSDFGCYGSEIPTPNIDRLARRGLRFTQFYNNARCSPSRAALLTGAHPHQAGLGHLAGTRLPGARGVLGGLVGRVTTIPDVLRSAGYHTAMAGKWHLGMGEDQRPWERGFDRSFALPAGGIYFRDQRLPRKGAHPPFAFINGRRVPLTSAEVSTSPNWYGTDLWTEWLLRFADEARSADKPFFLYLPHVAPHFPIMAPEADIARFRGRYKQGWNALREARFRRQQQMNLIGANGGLTPMLDTTTRWSDLDAAERERFDTMMAVYAAAVSRVDASVGRIVADLERHGELDNTLILIMSDNGGNAEAGPQGRTGTAPIGGPTSNVFTGMNWASLQNTPFRYFKHFTAEGGIASPLVAHWPNGIARGLGGTMVCDPAQFIDIAPTLFAIAGASYPKQRKGVDLVPLPGVDLSATFRGQHITRQRPMFWEHEGNRAVRDGRWKAVMRLGRQWELYDMDSDRTELNNLAMNDGERVTKMAREWDEWAAQTFVDPWPEPGRTDWGGKLGEAS